MNKSVQPPIIILVRPQLAENIGAVARAMGNFGLSTLRLVNPHVAPLDPKAIAMSAGANAILTQATLHDSLEEALADLAFVYATSASERQMIKQNLSVREVMPELITCATAGPVGIAFGPERTGLTNEELPKFRAILHVPVDPAFSSLNLAQAVSITAYEWYLTQTHFKGELHLGDTVPARQEQIQGFLNTLEGMLDDVHFWRIDHKKPIMWRNLQNIFTRMDLTEQEVRTLQGMIRSIRG